MTQEQLKNRIIKALRDFAEGRPSEVHSLIKELETTQLFEKKKKKKKKG